MNFNGTFTQAIYDLVQQVMPSLVVVRGHRYGAGSGIVWDASGLILTNNHVVGRRAPMVLLQDDREYESRLIARDPDVDLALLAIDAADLTPLKPVSASPRVGEMVFAVMSERPGLSALKLTNRNSPEPGAGHGPPSSGGTATTMPLESASVSEKLPEGSPRFNSSIW